MKKKPSRSLILTLSTPGRARTALLRRSAALALILIAALVHLYGLKQQPPVLAFSRDIAAGEIISEADLAVTRPKYDAAGMGAISADHREDIIGSISLAAAAQGEVVSKERILSSDFSADFASAQDSATHEATHIVAVSLAQPDIARMLHHGDVVSVITATERPSQNEDYDGLGTTDADAEVIAAGARVISNTTPGTDSDPATTGTILLSLPTADARTVAAASLNKPLTVVITGPRATPNVDYQAQS